MGKIAILLAIGCNELTIPCRVFTDMESGKKRCDEIFGVEGKDFKGGFIYMAELDREERPWPISARLFTSWCYGCGSPDRFILKTVAFDTSFIRYDLD